MHVTGSGILTDHKGRVFLQQSGETTLAPVHRPLEPGNLPTHTLDHAFREETGLIVLPVRLTGLYYDGSRADGELNLCFRCTMRGGDLKAPAGGQPAGFFDWPLLSGGLSPKYSRMVDDAIHHAGGPPNLVETGSGLSAKLGRLFGRQPMESDAESWTVSVRLTDGASGDMVEWVVTKPNEGQPDPTAPVDPAQPPWETAVRLLAQGHSVSGQSAVRLVGVEIASERPALTLLFVSA